MKLAILWLLCALPCFAQQPGVISVVPPGPGQQTTWVRAIAGFNEDADKTVCTMTTNRIGGTSNMHLYCTVGIGPAMRQVYNGDISVSLLGASLSFGGALNRVSLLLSRGLAVPDQWQITANDQFKTGAF
jgi:hypothetical protein